MLLIPTYLAPSPLHGLGLFTRFPLAKGAAVWRFDPRLDQLIQDDGTWTVLTQTYVERYGALTGERGWLLCGDDARFMNHEAKPSLLGHLGEPLSDDITTRELRAGDELTCNYDEFCLRFRERGGFSS